MGVEDIFEVAVAPGNVILGWLNSYSSIVVRTCGATLIFDPVQIEPKALIRADTLVITHEHEDHFDRGLVRECQDKLGIPVLTTPFVAQMLSKKAKVIKVGDYVSVGDIELLAERCDHPANEPLSFLILVKGAATLYHPGDSQSFPEMTQLWEKYRPDVLLYSGASIENAIQIAKLVRPLVIVAYYSERNWVEEFSRQADSHIPETQIRMLKRFEILTCPPKIGPGKMLDLD